MQNILKNDLCLESCFIFSIDQDGGLGDIVGM